MVWLLALPLFLCVIAVPPFSLRISLGEKRGKGRHFSFLGAVIFLPVRSMEQVDWRYSSWVYHEPAGR